MSRLEALAIMLDDLADKSNLSDERNALELCLGFADRIGNNMRSRFHTLAHFR
jgi:hypothetical protein